jgi:hypothetical protein
MAGGPLVFPKAQLAELGKLLAGIEAVPAFAALSAQVRQAILTALALEQLRRTELHDATGDVTS